MVRWWRYVLATAGGLAIAILAGAVSFGARDPQAGGRQQPGEVAALDGYRAGGDECVVPLRWDVVVVQVERTVRDAGRPGEEAELL